MEKLKKFAERLNGRQYRNEFTEEEKQYAKENGIVIVFGASDDLIEFDGAIYDEAGCWEGGRVWLDKEGNIFNDEESIKKGGMKYIDIFWCQEGQSFCWQYETDIPHETFDIMEDNESYCKGIVFYKKDLGDNMNSEKVKEIKKALEDNNTEHFPYIDGHKCKLLNYADILTIINEFESENERLLEQRNKTYNIWVKDTEELKARIAELEEDKEKWKRKAVNYYQRVKSYGIECIIDNDIDETLKEKK